MKKKLFLGVVALGALFFVTACNMNPGSKIMDLFIKAYVNADMNAYKELYPQFIIDYGFETQDSLNSSRDELKNTYGDDVKVTYKINEDKEASKEEVDEVNDDIKYYSKSAPNTDQCHKMKVSITTKGSKKEDTSDLDVLYCKFDGKWYLIDL